MSEPADAPKANPEERLHPITIGIWVFLGVFFLLSCYLGTWADFLCLVYPIYGTIIAIKSDTKDDDVFWIRYWFLFSIFKLGIDHSLVGPLLSDLYPWLFRICKVVFFVFCWCPYTQGTTVVYELLVNWILSPVWQVIRSKLRRHASSRK